jgi:LysM repeat protein
MKKKSITLYLLMCAPFWVMAQNYVAPPPLLPNPGYNANNNPAKEPVYAPETTNNINNTTLNQNGRIHLVKKGESLYRIAKLYNVTVDDIKAWNYLQSDLIAAGASLSIGTPAPYVANNVPAQYNQMTERSVLGWQTGLQNHTLLAGESLAAIANYYGLTEARLRSMNNLGPQDLVPAGYVLNVNPCLGNTSLGNNPPASYEQPNTPGNYALNGQDYNSPVPRYIQQDRSVNNNTPNSYNSYSNNSNNNSNPYNYRREDQYDPNASNNSGVPNSYEYTPRGGVPDNSNSNFGAPGTLIYENGRRVYVVGSNDTLETIADQYQVSAERLRYLNKMGAYDVVRPTQKVLLE